MSNNKQTFNTKEKAEDLVDKFIKTNGNAFFAKECALIAVDEIINNDGFTRHDDSLTEYWQEVKQEIENL